MKRKTTRMMAARSAASIIILTMLAGSNADGGYEICWYAIDGGGRTSVGNSYVLSGTIGQPDADWCKGNKYELLGGFWPGSPIECFPSCHSDYDAWVAVGKPACWCHERQCHGDTDGVAAGGAQTGYSYVELVDFNVLVAGWLVKEPPHGPGIASVPGGICADFAHDLEGDADTGFYRVGLSDLNIWVAGYLVKEPPHGPGIQPDCLDCP